ncbi:MAG TPA: MAPEG family protein [Rhizomicrobium sp.]|nr:MAPEG family protein [Rhizomicrobium sp.]
MSLVFESGYYAFGFYTAINALVMLVLAVLVTRARVTTQTDIGDGGKPEMAGPLRAHANNTEYVPMALLLLWALASPLGGSIWLIHGMGAPLTIGRILHAIGLSQSTGPGLLRLIGIMLTWISFIVGIVGVLYLVFFSQVSLPAA